MREGNQKLVRISYGGWEEGEWDWIEPIPVPDAHIQSPSLDSHLVKYSVA